MTDLGVTIVRQYQRNPQILAEIAAERTSTIVFPAQFPESVRAPTRFVEEEAGRSAASPPN